MSSFTRDNADREYWADHPAPAYPVILNQPNGKPMDLTGLSANHMAMTLVSTNEQSPATIEGSGTWTIRDAATGKVSYQWSTTDLAITPGYYLAYITALIPGDAAARVFGPDLIWVHSSLGGFMALQDVNITQVLGAAISPSNGVPTSEADGASVTIGAKADAAYSGSGAASVVALLKSLYNSLQPLQPARARVAPGPVPAVNAAATTANTDYSFKWGASGTTPVQAILLQNNSGSTINYNIDSAAGGATFTLADKQTAYIEVGGPILILHLYTSGIVQVNHASTPGICVEGWA